MTIGYSKRDWFSSMSSKVNVMEPDPASLSDSGPPEKANYLLSKSNKKNGSQSRGKTVSEEYDASSVEKSVSRSQL